MNLSEFNPIPVLAELDGDFFALRNFDLNAVVWADNHFDPAGKEGLNNLQENLRDSKNWNVFAGTIAETIYYLIEDRDHYPAICNFLNVLNATKNPSQSVAKLYKSLLNVFGNSFNTPKEEESQAKDGKPQKQDEDSTNWASIFVKISGSTGIPSIESFYKLTMKQIDSLLSVINKEKIDDLTILASLHDKKFKSSIKPKLQKSQFTKEDDEAFEKEYQKQISALPKMKK